ncbi:uncharacterized protein CLAFUR5_00822 [Fulvia fulva]|uniref:SnoaL-like domain-containing protein n=1 Tax=Passalora fulva TaxID=5499 RepID=A0A9Q8L5B3_PASFU|nr:uncharacterized protein CLAFUR5_00822 [Fulvia fulva]KAK4636849.1 hypothetical protein CLAFUR0_00821 [Fulvia fulva]UJO11103.1 hypothetical protein CLAFUR5_00822 [Fulvia fulva]
MSSNKTLPTPAEILQRFYDAETIYMVALPQKRDFSGMAATLSPDMKLVQSPDLLWSGIFHGHAGFQKWSETMASYFNGLEVTDAQVFEKSGSDSVVIHSVLKLRIRKNYKRLERPLVQVVKVDRAKGVIVEITPFYWDVKGLNEILPKWMSSRCHQHWYEGPYLQTIV